MTTEEIFAHVVAEAKRTNEAYVARLVAPSNAAPLILLGQKRRLLMEIGDKLYELLVVQRRLAIHAADAANKGETP